MTDLQRLQQCGIAREQAQALALQRGMQLLSKVFPMQNS